MNAATVTAQPFFEAALSGTGYCNGYANCTQAVVANEGGPGSNLTTQAVWYLYSDLDNGGFNFPRSMMSTPLNCPTGTEIGCNGELTSGVGLNASIGYSNYNAAFVTLKSQDWHGVTMQSNFTWSKHLVLVHRRRRSVELRHQILSTSGRVRLSGVRSQVHL
jgi:hypothetical protein